MSTIPSVVTNEEPPMGPDKLPHIKVIFRGFITAEIGPTGATIGALHPTLTGAACHKPMVRIYKVSTDEDISEDITGLVSSTLNLNVDLELKVSGESKVRVFWKDNEPFNRLDDIENDTKDFRWFVDFNELHKPTLGPKQKSVKIDKTKLSPQFKLNRGVLHSSKLSDRGVRIKPRLAVSDGKRFGRFAVETTARIVKNAGESIVLFQGTNFYAFETSADVRFEIVFDCTCRSKHEKTSDFPHVYDVITDNEGNGILITDQFDLEEDPVLHKVITPEVYCTSGTVLLLP